jgi:hypothetical protein
LLWSEKLFWLLKLLWKKKSRDESSDIYHHKPLPDILDCWRCRLLNLTVSSAQIDNIFWNKFEETLFRMFIWTTFLQIFSHPPWFLRNWWCRLLKSGLSELIYFDSGNTVMECTKLNSIHKRQSAGNIQVLHIF